MNLKGILLTIFTLFFSTCYAVNRWQMQSDGSIEWIPTEKLPHEDHIEMSGRQVSVVLRYGVRSDGSFSLNKSMIWPMLRTIPNDTHASLMRRFAWNPLDQVSIDHGTLVDEKIKSIRLNGMLRVESCFANCTVVRYFFPSTDQPALIERYDLINTSQKKLSVELPKQENIYRTEASEGVDGSYTLIAATDHSGSFWLNPGDTLSFSASIAGYKAGQVPMLFNSQTEILKRQHLLDEWHTNLVLQTPDEIINRMFAFSKIRACESIYQTACGPMHGPGGESYYAAIWANDESEYVGPYFPFTGYHYGNAANLNTYMLYARYMNKEWTPIPSSIIAEGKDIWNGAGDEGDAAMIAYGGARYIMERGSKDEAQKVWPLIKWCLGYCRHKMNAEGVVESDHDELEGRFPAGKANLIVSCLYYDALCSATYLAPIMGESKKQIADYKQEAIQLHKNIDHYFSAKIEGFDTYAYFKGNDVLRSWICIPLTVGIYERSKGTLQALFSRLWTENGLLTQADDKTFWDRSTLCALRGAFAAGQSDQALDFLHRYSEKRLLGDHVPYAIEAWPEGGQRHLSAESGLYGRILIEGLFGIRPTGFHDFSLSPHLPSSWNQAALRHIRAFESDFDVSLYRTATNKIHVEVTNRGHKVINKIIRNGDVIQVKL